MVGARERHIAYYITKRAIHIKHTKKGDNQARGKKEAKRESRGKQASKQKNRKRTHHVYAKLTFKRVER